MGESDLVKRSAKLARCRGGNEILASAFRVAGQCQANELLNKLAQPAPTAHKRTRPSYD
jgi:hypothetical protein